MDHPRQPPTPPQLPSPETLASADRGDRQADRLTEVLGDGADLDRTGGLIARFVASWEANQDRQPLADWLTAEFRQYPDLWRDAAEPAAAARDIILSVEAAEEGQRSLQAHLDRGKSRESWLAARIEQGAAAAGVTQVGLYAQSIDTALLDANIRAQDAIFNQAPDLVGDWQVSASPHLHGFLAETEVANRFNLDAAAGQSGLRAEVPSSQGWNSPDVVIRDGAGNLLQNVQIKSYADAGQAINNLRAHGYPPGTTLLVHEDQVARIQAAFPDLKVASTLEAGGIQVEMPSYRELKQRQFDAQMHEEARQYAWNDVSRIGIAKGIGKQAAIAAGLAVLMQGGRILGRRVWNRLAGRPNPPASAELREFFASSARGGGQVGLKAAISGAVVVAAKSGWLGAALRGTTIGRIANMVYVGIENARVLYRFAKGEINGMQALDAMGNVTCGVAGGLMGAGYGRIVGTMIGSMLGPVGAQVGGFVGGIVGGMAGSGVADLVYQGGKALVRTAVGALRTLATGVTNALGTLARNLNPLTWFAS